MINNEDMFYELPSGEINPLDVLFTLPNQFTGDMYTTVWIAGLYGVLTIGASRYQQSLQASSLYASYGVFIATFMLVLLGSFTETTIAGGNQLIPAAVILVANLLWNYMTGGTRL